MQIKLLSYRQYTVLVHVHERQGMSVDVALDLYKGTFMSLANRGYFSIDEDRVRLTRDGVDELSAYRETSIEDLTVKHQTDTRRSSFLTALTRRARPRTKVTRIKAKRKAA